MPEQLSFPRCVLPGCGLKRERSIGTPGRRDINPHTRFVTEWEPIR